MILKINGRIMYTDRVIAVEQTKPGEYRVETRCHGTYTVFGGRKAGGSPRDWFIEFPGWTKPLLRTSLRDAIKTIENM